MLIQTPHPRPPAVYLPQPATLWLKTPAAPERSDGTAPADATREEEREERLILCRECLFPVAREEDRTTMSGAFQHTFRTAEGCAHVGPASDEFTWFGGFAWRVGVCRGCLAHLGWFFAAPSGAAFWGLILDHLIFP
jgi:hypothetical protein